MLEMNGNPNLHATKSLAMSKLSIFTLRKGKISYFRHLFNQKIYNRILVTHDDFRPLQTRRHSSLEILKPLRNSHHHSCLQSRYVSSTPHISNDKPRELGKLNFKRKWVKNEKIVSNEDEIDNATDTDESDESDTETENDADIDNDSDADSDAESDEDIEDIFPPETDPNVPTIFKDSIVDMPLRADKLVGHFLTKTRTDAVNLFYDGKIKHNYATLKKKSTKVKENDILDVWHEGAGEQVKVTRVKVLRIFQTQKKLDKSTRKKSKSDKPNKSDKPEKSRIAVRVWKQKFLVDKKHQ